MSLGPHSQHRESADTTLKAETNQSSIRQSNIDLRLTHSTTQVLNTCIATLMGAYWLKNIVVKGTQFQKDLVVPNEKGVVPFYSFRMETRVGTSFKDEGFLKGQVILFQRILNCIIYSIKSILQYIVVYYSIKSIL